MPHTHSHKEDGFPNRLQYWKRVKDIMEMHELKEKSIHFRKKLLQDRTNASYRNEYEK